MKPRGKKRGAIAKLLLLQPYRQKFTYGGETFYYVPGQGDLTEFLMSSHGHTVLADANDLMSELLHLLIPGGQFHIASCSAPEKKRRLTTIAGLLMPKYPGEKGRGKYGMPCARV